MSTSVLGSRAAVEDSDGAVLPPLATRAVLFVAVAFTALELAVSARYGFHRDELYFLACARHLAWGYVDQPPFVPGVAWLAAHALGTTPVSLRLLPAIAGGVAVVCTAQMARELHGGRNAQVLAALAAATSSQFVGAFHLLSTTPFDFFFWSVLSLLVLRVLRTGDERLWLAVGALAGVALLNKMNVLFLLAGLGVGLWLGGHRDVFRSLRLWAGLGLALLIWSPNIVWNAQHDWAALSMVESLHRENSTVAASVVFVPSQLFAVGPVLVLFWLAGLRSLWRSNLARPFAVGYVALLVLFTLTGAKPYYLGGIYYVLFAAGGVWAERRLAARTPPKGLRGWITLMVVGLLLTLPVALPVLPESSLPKGSWEGNVNKDLSATVGWPQLARQVAGVVDSLPAAERAHVVVFTGDYGAAGAVDLFGPALGLPHAISGHNSYWWWGPAGATDGAITVAVNLSRPYLRTIFAEVTSAGSVTTPNGVWSEERGDPIWICRGQYVSWARAWADARHYG